jgi:hypothetical protein
MSTDTGKDMVVSTLESFAQRTQEILNRIDGRSQISAFEKDDLQALYGALKDDVKAAGKLGKVEYGRHEQTDWERYYFAPAMMKAASSLRAKSNTNPITSNWLSSLLDAGMEFSYYLHLLRKT